MNESLFDGDLSPSQLAWCERRRKRLSEQLGIPIPTWQDEATAPPIDMEALKDMVENRLSPEEHRRINWLIWSYRSWATATMKIWFPIK